MTRRGALRLTALGVLGGGVAIFSAARPRRRLVAPAAVPAVAPVPVPTPVPVPWEVTGYCPCSACCGEWADGVTATGAPAVEGRTVAADWRVLPPGSRVRIPGLGWRVVEDRGGAIRGRRIDVFFASHDAAKLWGRKRFRSLKKKVAPPLARR